MLLAKSKWLQATRGSWAVQFPWLGTYNHLTINRAWAHRSTILVIWVILELPFSNADALMGSGLLFLCPICRVIFIMYLPTDSFSVGISKISSCNLRMMFWRFFGRVRFICILVCNRMTQVHPKLCISISCLSSNCTDLRVFPQRVKLNKWLKPDELVFDLEVRQKTL